MSHRSLSTLIIAAVTFVAGSARGDAGDECGKNHYILDRPPCLQLATTAAIGAPGAVAVDPAGGFYFSSPNVVLHVDADGHLTRVAGNGTPGFSGDGGPAIDALLGFPLWYFERELDSLDFEELHGPLAVDATGNLYIGDQYNNRVRMVDKDGYIRTIAGNGERRYYYWYRGDNGVRATDVAITWPSGVAVRDDGTVIVASAYGPMFEISPQGMLATVVAGCGPGYHGPSTCGTAALAIDASGDVVAAARLSCGVRKVLADGRRVTIAGAVDFHWRYECGHGGDGGPAIDATVSEPSGVAADRNGNVFIADTWNHCIRRVDAKGIISTFAGQCTRRGFVGDGGLATEALLQWPRGVAVDRLGNVYIADTRNLRIRKVGVDGIITTVAGTGRDLPMLPATRP